MKTGRLDANQAGGENYWDNGNIIERSNGAQTIKNPRFRGLLYIKNPKGDFNPASSPLPMRKIPPEGSLHQKINYNQPL